MSQYFPKPREPFSGNINVKVDLSNYATKDDIKNITHVDTSSFALKSNLANLKTKIDKLDIDKLKPVPTDLSKLSDVVKNDVVKKTDYNKLVTKVDNIDTSGFVKKTDYNTKINEIKNKIPHITNLATKTASTTVENKIPNITTLATKTALTTVENKIPDITNLATKTASTAVENKISNITTLATKTALTTVENKIPDITNLATKTALTTVENKIPDINNFDKTKYTFIAKQLSYLHGKTYFDEDGRQNYLAFLPMIKYFKLNSVVDVVDRVLSWRSKGITNESITAPITSDNNPKLSYYGTKIRVQFTRSCLKQSKITFTHKKIVNI